MLGKRRYKNLFKGKLSASRTDKRGKGTCDSQIFSKLQALQMNNKPKDSLVEVFISGDDYFA